MGFTNGNVTITGSADVTATGGTVTRKQGNDDSRGIYADYVTVEGGTVRATGGEESIASYGICTVYDVTITGGTVIAKGREAEMFSDGIYAKGDYDYDNEFIGGGNVTISGGTVTATGDTATWESCGIFAVSSVTLSGTAQVTATGSNAEKFSSGIYVDLTNEGSGLTISGGSLLAQASSEAESCAALRAEPDLTGYAAYYWRTDAQGSYTEGNFVWNNDPYATYVEIRNIMSDLDANPFTDLNFGEYYYNAVLWAVENGITNGTSDTTFSPYMPCTRAQTVTFLWRAAGCPTPQISEMPFTDVVRGSYYETAVLWAVENGITEGTSDTTFSPDIICDRAQFVTLLWRSQDKPAAGTDNYFTDVVRGSYYETAVLWAVENGITNGTSNTTFSPDYVCTRSQVVTFLYRCLGE